MEYSVIRMFMQRQIRYWSFSHYFNSLLKPQGCGCCSWKWHNRDIYTFYQIMCLLLYQMPIYIHQWLSQHSIVYILCMYISIWLYAWICVTYYILDRVGFVGIIIMSISMFFIIWFKYIALQNSLCSLITYEFIIKLHNAFLVAVVITWTG